ncbi:MAG: hypothetical protein HQL52_13150 [Magnetococcales bacterium]|nr:hypothetical protein [Magnetococcales bacterium]
MINFFPAYDAHLPQETRKVLEADFIQTDRFMLLLLGIQWGIVSTLTAYTHGFYLLGFIGGGVTTGIAYVGYRFFPGSAVSRTLIGISFIVFSAIMIQQHMGRIEMHFHVFVSLSFLVRYKDILPLLAASATAVIHHGLFNLFQIYDTRFFDIPLLVFNYGYGWDIVLLHGVFVIAATVALSMIILQITGQFITDSGISAAIQRIITEKDLSIRVADSRGKGILVNQFLDTLGQIFNAIREQAGQVEGLIRELVTIQTQLNGNSEQTRAIAQEVVEENKSLGGDISGIRTSVESSSGHIEVISDAAVDLSSHLGTILQSTQITSDVVGSVTDSAEQIKSNLYGVNESQERVNRSVGHVSSVLQGMTQTLADFRIRLKAAKAESGQASHRARDILDVSKKLTDSAGEIDLVVEGINDIADQTNMLALNASIEAAGAGEAGKGFAVVANEVKELAHQTANATRAISQKIAQVQSISKESTEAVIEITAIVEKIHHTNDTINFAMENQEATMGQLATSMGEVQADVNVVTQSARDLEGISQELGIASDNAVNNTQEITEAVAHASDSAGQVAEKSSESRALSQTIRDAAGRTDTASSQVMASVSGVFELITQQRDALDSLSAIIASLEQSGEQLHAAQNQFSY